MPKDESTSRVETRAFLQSLSDALSQPPLGAQFRATMIGLLNLLGEQTMGIRWAYRERSPSCWPSPTSRSQLPPAAPARGSGRGRWGAQGYIRTGTPPARPWTT